MDKLEYQEVIKIKKLDLKIVSQMLMAGSATSVFLAAVGYLGYDIWLASTQWLIVSAVLALFGLYFKK